MYEESFPIIKNRIFNGAHEFLKFSSLDALAEIHLLSGYILQKEEFPIEEFEQWLNEKRKQERFHK